MQWHHILLVDWNDWHIISDIMSETMVVLVMIHIMGLQSSDVTTLLRYIAFSLLWLAKSVDGWDSISYEVIVFILFGIPTIVRMLGLLSPPPPYKKDLLMRAMACGAAGVGALEFGMLLEDYWF